MNEKQVNQIISSNAFPDESKNISLIETHISWIILSANFAFKIKKPVCFSFLDFSTLEKRKFYCKEELRLNRRLTKDIYLDVLAITSDEDGKYSIGGNGIVVDYCVKMKRMDNDGRMDKLLKKDKVDRRMMFQLADTMVDFHQKAKVLTGKVNADLLKEDFDDILNFKKEIAEILGAQAFSKIERGIEETHHCLNKLEGRISWREKEGWIRDGHGDLHSANIIFENDQPIVFDCIEFNEHFRQQDLLSELAFLCMDLAFYDKEHLSQCFLNKYLRTFNCMLVKEDYMLFLFYKLYRANIKVKVNVIKAHQAKDDAKIFRTRIRKAKKYLKLYSTYVDQIKEESFDFGGKSFVC